MTGNSLVLHFSFFLSLTFPFSSSPFPNSYGVVSTSWTISMRNLKNQLWLGFANHWQNVCCPHVQFINVQYT